MLILGYEMFRIMTKKDLPNTTEWLLNPGADLVVCDEGHRIKNDAAHISLALKKINTKYALGYVSLAAYKP